jgi:hypothetical protein
MSEGHGTGYEDAISRKIAAAEARAQVAEHELDRERVQGKELAMENGRLRARAAESASAARAARLGAWLAWFLCALAVAAAAIFALLWQGYRIPGIS